MSFRDTHSGADRTRTLVIVGAIHAAAFYAIVTGLGGAVIRMIEPPPLDGYNVPPEVEIPITTRPDRPRHPVTQRETQTQADEQPVFIDQGLKIDLGPVLPFTPPPTGPGDGLTKTEATPSFAPKLATPTSKPGTWASDADYPPADLHAYHEGITRFRLAITADGHVDSCTVTQSSGWPGLDAATCRAVSSRARFRPATDETGARVSGSFASAIRWVIPKD